MMTEAEVTVLLNSLRDKLKAETNPARVIAWSGGVSALEMVLQE